MIIVFKLSLHLSTYFDQKHIYEHFKRQSVKNPERRKKVFFLLKVGMTLLKMITRKRVKMMASSAHVVCNSHTHVASKFVTCFLSASVTHNSSSTYINIGPYGHIMTFELNAHIT